MEKGKKFRECNEEERKALASGYRIKFEGRTPILVIPQGFKEDIHIMEVYLVEKDKNIVFFMHQLRQKNKLTLTPYEGLFLIIKSDNKEIIPMMSQTIGELDKKYSGDSFLTIYLCKENCFG
jgi:hypothetical protein